MNGSVHLLIESVEEENGKGGWNGWDTMPSALGGEGDLAWRLHASGITFPIHSRANSVYFRTFLLFSYFHSTPDGSDPVNAMCEGK